MVYGTGSSTRSGGHAPRRARRSRPGLGCLPAGHRRRLARLQARPLGGVHRSVFVCKGTFVEGLMRPGGPAPSVSKLAPLDWRRKRTSRPNPRPLRSRVSVMWIWMSPARPRSGDPRLNRETWCWSGSRASFGMRCVLVPARTEPRLRCSVSGHRPSCP